MLAGVRGETTSTIVETGSARLTGSVQGPGGLIPGATVRIERLVADREVRTDVLTGPDGRFTVEGAPGGRYRVRAFLAPSFIQLEPEVRFLADGEEHAFDLSVEQVGGLVVRADVAPDTPVVDEPVNLVAAVLTRTVGADGILRSTPVTGATVELVGLGRWRLRSPAEADPPDEEEPGPSTSVTFGTTTTTTSRQSAPSPLARTDGRGIVRYELRCQTAGDPGLALRIPVTITPPPDASGAPSAPQQGTETVTLQLPACVDNTTATTAGSAPSSSGSTSTTSTTEP
jgi:hypothetical protein